MSSHHNKRSEPGPSRAVKSARRIGIEAPTETSLPLTLLSHDEPHLNLTFNGRNDTTSVEVDGWTRKRPLKFVNLPDYKKIKAISATTPPDQMPAKLSEMMNACVDLKEIASKVGPNNSKMPDPVIVTVLAKKTIDFHVKLGGALMFGEMLIGDKTGFCKLCVSNDSIHSIYNEIQVGDKLLIGTASVREVYREFRLSTLCLNNYQNFLHFDVRAGMYDFRHIYKVEGVDDGKLPTYYTEERKILSVSELTTPSISECSVLKGKDGDYDFDIIGIVSHVGRLERHQDCRYDVKLETSDPTSVQFFSVFRWIELVDRHSREPIPLLFYVGTDTWDIQRSLFPGSLLLVSNVRRHSSEISPAIVSTKYSQMYLNNEIESYLALFPDSVQLKKIHVDFLCATAAKDILERTDVEWSVGGSYSRAIADEEVFVRSYLDRQQQGTRSASGQVNKSVCSVFRPGHEHALLHRESRRFAFKGFIFKFRKVTSKCREVETLNRNPQMKEEYNEIFKPGSRLVSSMALQPQKNWYMFKRQLPRIYVHSISLPKKPSSTYLYEALSVQYKKYCEPLLMPAEGDMNLLKDLPALDCFPHLSVHISNREEHEQYSCIWKPNRCMSLENMMERLKSLVNCRSLCILVDAHLTGIDPETKSQVFELILQDVADFRDCGAGVGSVVGNER